MKKFLAWKETTVLAALLAFLIIPLTTQAGGIAIFSRVGDEAGNIEITIGDTVSGQLITTNTIQVVDKGGDAVASRVPVRVWMSSTEYGAPTTNNTEGLTLTGTEISYTTADADIWQLSDTNGVITATVTASAVAATYINAAAGIIVVSEEIALVP